MIIRKKSQVLYWISDNQNLDGIDVSPSIPRNFLTQKKAIDDRTKRILLYDNLDDAISTYGVGKRSLKGMTLSVYKPRFIRKENKIEPSLSDCPYSLALSGKEYWSLIPLEMEKIADIKIGDVSGEKEFKYGGRTIKGSLTLSEKLKSYSWSEILPEWDKKGKSRKL